MIVVNEISVDGQKFHRGAVTIGNFDGLHLGHQALLHKACSLGGPVIVMTFDPHPVQVLYPEKELRRLFPRVDLIEQLPGYGVELLWILPFSRQFADWPASRFLEQCLWRPLRPRHVIVGYDFAFGRSREGTLEGLRAWGVKAGVDVHVVEPKTLGSEVVSSRRIRELLSQGKMEDVNACLNRRFYLRGKVIKGAGRGAGLGSPTLNMEVVNETYPANGVYATFAVLNGRRYRSVTNIGVNPTFGGGPVKVETHVLDPDFKGWEGGMDTEFVAFLRPEIRFSSVEDLKKQIERDILEANEALDRNLGEYECR
jgi:riboflavin kinase/FMN adenylyltransferase